MNDANAGYRLTFDHSQEVREGCAIRDTLLRLFAAQMRAGVPPDHPDTLALVDRYRREFIDVYLYQSTLAHILGLSAVIYADGNQRVAYDAYGEGLAAYLAQAFRSYYDTRHQ